MPAPRPIRPSRVLVLAALLAACAPPASQPADLRLPRGFPMPRVPADNPLTVDKVELGRRLFYDGRLSGNGTQSCASCHRQELAFTDGKPQGVGSTGQVHPRSSMSLVNVGYAITLTWANPLLTTLEQQALLPLFGERPVELGLAGREDELLARLAADDDYRERFARSFPEDADGEPITLANLLKALGSFQRTLISGRSAYDRFIRNEDPAALSPSAQRGLEIFFSERAECFHCHGGFAFAGSVAHAGTTMDEINFHNNGLYSLDEKGSYPAGNQGLYDITGKDRDRGLFRAPTLRNIAVTAPYMHDGSLATLEEVIEHYARGGRLTTTPPNAGDGALNPNKSVFVRKFTLSDTEKADLLAFLRALTDEEFLRDPRFSDPFAAP